jgi:hypothetical protein
MHNEEKSKYFQTSSEPVLALNEELSERTERKLIIPRLFIFANVS